MKVWLVTVGEPLPTDQKGIRLLRTGILAEQLSEKNHEVVWWNSTFDHSKKEHRFTHNKDIQYKKNFLIKVLHGCGYNSSISLKRIWDHILVAYQFRKLSKTMPKPDVILCSLPTLELSQVAVTYGKKNRVPVVIDVRDLWPDLFLDYVPNKIRPIFNLFLSPMWWQARYACRGAAAITACAPAFVEWGIKLANREKTKFDKFFPFGYVSNKSSPDQLQTSSEKWKSLGIDKDKKQFTVCFFGTLGSQFDIETVIEAAKILKKDNAPMTFVICGAGDSLKKYQELAQGIDSVIFPGWVGASDIWTLMKLSDVGIAPYFNNAGFSGNLPNKTIEYLSAGLPVVSSLRGYFENFLKEEYCGVSYLAGDAAALVQELSKLSQDRETLAEMSKNALNIFNKKFMAEKVYGDMIDYLQELANKP